VSSSYAPPFARRLFTAAVLTASCLALGALGACGGDDSSSATTADADGGTSGDAAADGQEPRKDPVIPTNHPRIYMGAGPKARLAAKLSGSTPAAVRFRDMVDSQITGTDHYAFQPWNASLMGALTGDVKYCTYAVAQTEAWVAGEETRIGSGQAAEVAGDNYLEVGDIIGGLALVYDHCFATLTDAQKARWKAYGYQAVWNVWHPDDARWGSTPRAWNGWSIDNPYNNYHYSFLRATMLLGLAIHGEGPEGAELVDLFRKDKLAKLVTAFEQNLKGGGSREGTGYGTSFKTLFELYDFWEATTGERIWDLTTHTRESLAHFMHATVPTLDRIAPFGDHARDSEAKFFDYHRELVLAAQHLVGADPLSEVAQTFLEGASINQMEQYFLYVWDFLYADPAHAKQPLSKLSRTYYGPGTGMTFMRSAWTNDATWGALIGGPYTESHAHHDQGSLLFYKNGWLGYDANIASASGIAQEEELHNLVRLVEGGSSLRMQESKSPGQTVSLADTGDVVHWAAKLDALYGNADVTKVEREVVFVRPLETFVVFDRIEANVTSSVWQLNAPVTPTEAAGKWSVAGAGGTGLELFILRPNAATGVVMTWPGGGDVKSGARLDVTSTGHTRYLTVLGAKGRVTSATGSEAAGSTTATLSFAGGASGTVSFSTDGAGGQVTLNGGGLTVNQALTTGVTAPPVFAP
jgi:hypothetical protein